MDKIKVLHLLSSNQFTNIENEICHSITLLRNDFNMAYCSPNGPISKDLRSKEVNYLPIENFDFKVISSIIADYSPNIIHAHNYEACVIASKFSKNIKVIAELHENSKELNKLSFKSLTFNNASKHFAKIVWPTEEIKNSYKYIKNIDNKSLISSIAIDCENTIEKSNEQNKENLPKFDILMFAEDMSNEEIKKVINFLAILQGRGFTFKFGAITSKKFDEEIKSYLTETGVDDSFVFVNQTSNYHYILSKSKILFVAREYEETPIYVLEASALGVPVLSIFSNGLKNVIQNEFNGFLANNEYDLANFAARLLDDRNLWLLLSTNSLTTSYTQNDIQKYQNELKNLYLNII